MIEKATLSFLASLKKNNVREWFEGNRARYEAARSNQLEFLVGIIKGVGAFDRDVAVLEPKQVIFRINRDIRFSKDKTPYKTHLSAYFARGGRKSEAAGYYLQIAPGNSFAAAGCWWPGTKQLGGIRQEIDYNFAEWKKITANARFKKMFTEGFSKEDVLQRAPKGYDEANPAIEFLKLKSFAVYRRFTDAEVTDAKFAKQVISVYATAKPLVDFLNAPAEDADHPD